MKVKFKNISTSPAATILNDEKLIKWSLSLVKRSPLKNSLDFLHTQTSKVWLCEFAFGIKSQVLRPQKAASNYQLIFMTDEPVI